MERTETTSIDDYIVRNVDTWLVELSTFCAQPSISARGQGLRETAEMLADMLRRRGFEAQIMETGGAPVVYAEGGEGDRTLIMYNHYDVQPPEPLDRWE